MPPVKVPGVFCALKKFIRGNCLHEDIKNMDKKTLCYNIFCILS